MEELKQAAHIAEITGKVTVGSPAPVDNRLREQDRSNEHIGFKARLDAAKAQGRDVVYLPHQASRQRKRYLRQQILSGLRQLHNAPKIVRSEDLLGGIDNAEKFRTADHATLVAMWQAIEKELAE